MSYSLYNNVSFLCSQVLTKKYSTSFSLGIFFINKKLRQPIYSIYGFVRLADEIVDTFHENEKEKLLQNFERDICEAIKVKLSLNPILHSFQHTVNEYGIDANLIDTFLQSMRMDLYQKQYEQKEYEQYILGSAEVVGLMCLKVFLKEEETYYENVKTDAMKLASAFQKINFLRDAKQDMDGLGRNYFPHINLKQLSVEDKKNIEQDIKKDFLIGLHGIKKLPTTCRFGVFVAYVYYYALFKKIKKLSPQIILKQRVRISDFHKTLLLAKASIQYWFL